MFERPIFDDGCNEGDYKKMKTEFNPLGSKHFTGLKKSFELSNGVYAVILAGGRGERFWPLSRYYVPKQLLKLTSDKTLIQQTISRIIALVPSKNIYIVTNFTLFDLIKKQISDFEIPLANILLEPGEPKNTAPAITWAALRIFSEDPRSIMIVLPSDHYIKEKNKFLITLKCAQDLAFREDCLVTFGIKPDRAETGYGYIRTYPKFKIKNFKIFKVDKFIEKPDLSLAKKLIKDVRCFWNSGMFVFKAKTILYEVSKQLPTLYKDMLRVNKQGAGVRKIWQKLPAISIDYGIMEKSKKVVMIPLYCNWSDLGSWDALGRVFPRDKSGNIFYADLIDRDSKNITVWGKDFLGTKPGRLIATIGLQDLIIVDTPDALLVCKKDKSQEVKKIVEKLKIKGKEEILSHRSVERPWGSFTVLDTGKKFKVKLVEVESHKRLSLQRHHKRAEHWVVVEGKAKVTCGKNIRYIAANESIFIPKNTVHRLENPQNIPLKIIEVQTGIYLQEDDIERISDDFSRKNSLFIKKLIRI